MLFKKLNLLLTWLFFLLIGTKAWTQIPLILNRHQNCYQVGHHLEYLADPSGKLTIADVLLAKYSKCFQQSRRVPNFGYTDSAYWVRIQFKNPLKAKQTWLLELKFPNMQDIEYYRPNDDNSGFEKIHTGTFHSFYTREIPYHRFVFSFSIPPFATRTIYMRFKNEASMTLPLVVWPKKSFLKNSYREILFSGCFYGALLIMIGYNFFLWIALKDHSYFCYILLLTMVLSTQFIYSGFAEQYLWPDAISWKKVSVIVFLPLIPIAALQFTDFFLCSWKKLPAWHTMAMTIMIMWTILLALVPFLSYSRLIRIMMPLRIISSLLLISYTLRIWYDGYRPARYFFAAWVLSIASNIQLSLIRMGVIESTSFGEQSYLSGVILMTLLFSLALADRIQTLRKEKKNAQELAIKSLEKHDRLISEQNIILEREVEKRTAELQKYQGQLESKVEEELAIRRRQEDMLIQKSKLESLGVLAAGISHEINQPLTRISFCADNILLKLLNDESLKADYLESKVQTLLDCVDRISHIIEHVRMFSREQQQFCGEEIDVNATIENTLSLVCSQYKNHDITIEADLQASGRTTGNQYKLEQVLLNLLSNARDAIEMRDDCIYEKWIKINTKSNQEEIIIEIVDNGTGMSCEQAEHIFDPFFTTKDVGKGTGLGLSISYGIIKEMNGNIEVLDYSNNGTTMQITLPKH